MTELRQEIARKICDVWGYIWDGDPDDAQTAPDKNDGYDTRPSKELFLEAADALLPLISKAEQRGAWQSIETAPRDGRTEIIGRDAAGRVRRTWYFAPSSRTQQWVRFEDNVPWKPIHWMPLPAPPLPTEEE